MNAHCTIAFAGKFRPIHTEAETLPEAVKVMRGMIHGDPLETLNDLWQNFQRQRKAGINMVSACADRGCFNVTIADYPRNSWLDSITCEFPVSPWKGGEA